MRPIIGSNTYSQVQQKLQLHPPIKPNIGPPMLSNVPPPPIPPAFISTFMPQQHDHNAPPEKSYNSEPTPVVLSSAPKLYNNRPMAIQPNEIPMIHQQPHVKINFNLIVLFLI